MSKGSKRRPENLGQFEDNFNRIFGDKRPERGRFIFDESKGRLVPASEYVEPVKDGGLTVVPDIQPYQSMVTGEIITSRSHHVRHLRDHGMVEVGNDSSLNKPYKGMPDTNPGQRKELLKHYVNQFTDKEWRKAGERHRQAVMRHMERNGKD